ncbi:MAG TPA: hypothetical protein VEB40_14010 [Flavipsychrobacter sp.]|nr:hypothetical protein [Flavipsychrobacter sp.]
MKITGTALVAVCLAIASCKKQQVQPADVPIPPSYPSYSALNVGNYWVYERYFVNLLTDSSAALGVYDSSYVEKDTLINEKNYFKCVTMPYTGFFPTIKFLRDSLHYIVSSSGEIEFSSVDFSTFFDSDAFGPSLAAMDTVTRNVKMTVRDSTITVPAGSFVASAVTTTYDYADPSKADLHLNAWYAKNIGRVKYIESLFYRNFEAQELRLLRYHVQ